MRVLTGFAYASLYIVAESWLNDRSTNKTRGIANGIQGFIATLGAFIPPILAFLPSQFVARGYTETAAQQATFAIAAQNTGTLTRLGILWAAFVFAAQS